MGKMEGSRLSALRTFELELKGTWEVHYSDFPFNKGLSLTKGHSASSKLAPSITEQLRFSEKKTKTKNFMFS